MFRCSTRARGALAFVLQRFLLAGLFVFAFWFGGERAASAQLVTSSAWLRTPDSRSPAADGVAVEPDCMDCSYNSAGQANAWAYKGGGEYTVILHGVAPASGGSVAYHVNAFGMSSVSCAAVPRGTGPLGTDYYITVRCTDVVGGPVASRFSLVYKSMKGTVSNNFDTGFLEVANNAIVPSGTYTTGTQAPTLTKTGVGKYRIVFGGLLGVRSLGKGGNAQVTARRSDRRCTLDQWYYATSSSVQIDLTCLSGSSTQTDTDFQVTFGQIGVISSADTSGHGMIWSGNKGSFTTYTPDAGWNRSMNASDPSHLMTVTRRAKGRYTVNYAYSPTIYSSGAVMTLVSPWQSTASCVTTSVDSATAQLECTTSAGAYVDSAFSFQMGEMPRFPTNTSSFHNVGSNFTPVFDVGHGLMCGMSALASNRLQCSLPVYPGQNTFPAIAGGTLPNAALPNAQKSIAIDNVDMTTTTILTLGSDNVLRGIPGDLRLPWGPIGAPTGNFQQVNVVANPVMNTGASVVLKKVVVVRSPSVIGSIASLRDVVGLTSANTLVQLGGNKWYASTYKVPSSGTLKDISHGTKELYLLMTDGTMYLSTRSAVTALPALPKGLKPVAMGGPFVITNAGADANGQILCKEPKVNGCYQCAGEWDRFYQFSDSGRWIPAFQDTCNPTEDNSNIIVSFTPPPAWGYNPYATYSPTIVDARLFAGETASTVMFQSFSRLYYAIH